MKQNLKDEDLATLYQQRLESCVSREEILLLKKEQMGNFMNAAKHILLGEDDLREDKQRKLEDLLLDTKKIQEIHQKFLSTELYADLPSNCQSTQKRGDKEEFVHTNSDASFENVRMEIESLIREADMIRENHFVLAEKIELDLKQRQMIYSETMSV